MIKSKQMFFEEQNMIEWNRVYPNMNFQKLVFLNVGQQS